MFRGVGTVLGRKTNDVAYRMLTGVFDAAAAQGDKLLG